MQHVQRLPAAVPSRRTRAARPPAHEGTVRGGLNLVQHGRGPRRVLCLHGLAGSADTFLTMLPHLPADVSLLAVDLPGYGRSEPPSVWTPDGLCDALLQGLDAHGVEGPIEVIGNCSGAIMAVLLKERAPARFGRLHLVEPFSSTPWFFAIFTLPILGALFFWSTFYTPIGRALTNLRLSGMRGEDVDMTEGFSRCPAYVPLGYLRALRAVGDARRFAGLPAEVRLIRGARTFPAIEAGVEVWRSVWPDAEVRVLPEAGHVPFRESPGALADAALGDARRA